MLQTKPRSRCQTGVLNGGAARRHLTAKVLPALLTALWLAGEAGAAVPVPRQLAKPDADQTLETVHRGLATAAVQGERLVMLGAREPALGIALDGRFIAAGKSREARFGKLTDQVRRPIFKDGTNPAGLAWRGLDLGTPRPLLFDGAALTMHEVDPVTLTSVISRSLPWDLIKPPRDRGGEPTGPETAELRAAFKRAFLGTLGVKGSGLAPVPAAWGLGKATVRHYLMATRLKGFPLVLVECQASEPSACVVVRHCRLEGAGDLAPEHVAGLALRAADRLVVIADRARRRLLGFKFHSCLHVSRREDWLLPEKLPDPTSIGIDGDGRLWITTGQPDDYHNASLFYWSAGSW